MGPYRSNPVSKPGELRETLTCSDEGNPELSLQYTAGKCNDYWRGKALLMTRISARHPEWMMI
jgi:hypothetical protein